MLIGQKRVLEMVASGAPLADALAELTRFIEAQEDGLRCGILMLTDDGMHFRGGVGPNLPEAYHRALEGAAVGPPHVAPCAEAAHLCETVVVPDIATDTRYSEEWRSAVLSSGLPVCRSAPIRVSTGRVAGTFAIYYDHRRDPNPGEPQLVEIATHLAGIALERRRPEQALRRSEERLRHIVESATEYVIITLDRERRITSWNSGAERMLGYREAEALGRSGDMFFTAEDRAAGEPVKEARMACEQGRAADERWHVRKDGSRFWGSGFMMPVEGDEADAYLKIFHDRTRERQAEERQKWLVYELNHRVKNMLSIVQAIASQTLRSADVEAGVRESFESRLVALAHGHNLLTRDNWEGAELHDVVSAGLAPFCSVERQRLHVDGPLLSIGPKAALALTMALHELATNAVKYGALSKEGGRVDITWTVDGTEPPRLRFRWRESGGPPVAAPRHKGFGSRLIERGLSSELGGEVQLEYARAGLVCSIDAPVPNLSGGPVPSHADA